MAGDGQYITAACLTVVTGNGIPLIPKGHFRRIKALSDDPALDTDSYALVFITAPPDAGIRVCAIGGGIILPAIAGLLVQKTDAKIRVLIGGELTGQALRGKRTADIAPLVPVDARHTVFSVKGARQPGI